MISSGTLTEEFELVMVPGPAPKAQRDMPSCPTDFSVSERNNDYKGIDGFTMVDYDG